MIITLRNLTNMQELPPNESKRITSIFEPSNPSEIKQLEGELLEDLTPRKATILSQGLLAGIINQYGFEPTTSMSEFHTSLTTEEKSLYLNAARLVNHHGIILNPQQLINEFNKKIMDKLNNKSTDIVLTSWTIEYLIGFDPQAYNLGANQEKEHTLSRLRKIALQENPGLPVNKFLNIQEAMPFVKNPIGSSSHYPSYTLGILHQWATIKNELKQFSNLTDLNRLNLLEKLRSISVDINNLYNQNSVDIDNV